ncbi:MAG: zinc ribbon domain-containing protein [Myxococcales bacterium]|jgi:putative FmdB family regulatory protein|nr:zinc ribbon domain-containing protein [Myxococcales bacterium]
MPIYAYRCSKCGADAEYIQKFDDPPMTVCEACGGPLARAVTAAAFHLKGGGWYKDGYASAKADGGDSKSSDSKSDAASSTTSTPAAKSEPAAAAPAPAAPKAAAE